jgi:hypothetical protein
MEQEPAKGKCPARKWTRSVGWAAFLFFLIKGLLWLVVPVLVTYYAVD